MQMFFDKINSGSSFGIIREDFFFSPQFSPQLRQFLDKKRHFIGFVEIDCNLDGSLFFVCEKKPSAIFSLKDYLLVLAQKHGYPQAICYYENKQDMQNTDAKEIKFLSAKSHDFGKEFDFTTLYLSNRETFKESLLELGDSLFFEYQEI